MWASLQVRPQVSFKEFFFFSKTDLRMYQVCLCVYVCVCVCVCVRAYW